MKNLFTIHGTDGSRLSTIDKIVLVALGLVAVYVVVGLKLLVCGPIHA